MSNILLNIIVPIYILLVWGLMISYLVNMFITKLGEGLDET